MERGAQDAPSYLQFLRGEDSTKTVDIGKLYIFLKGDLNGKIKN